MCPPSSEPPPIDSGDPFDESRRNTSPALSPIRTQGVPSDTLSEPPGQTPSGALAERFGPYVIVDELGRGGMGIVYRVRDTRLGRAVALKKIRSGLLASPQEIERFNREARAIAQLKHPHVIQL
jgi:serine/threonine protein kinase